MSLRKPHPFADRSLQTSQSGYVIITQPHPFTIAVMAQVAFSVLQYSWTIGVGIGGEEANLEAKKVFFHKVSSFQTVACPLYYLQLSELLYWLSLKHQ